MLKFFFWALLLIDAVLFALYRGYFEPIFPSAHEPKRLQQQISPDNIHLLRASPPSSARMVAATSIAVAPVDKPPATLACIELGDFNEIEANRFEAQIGALSLNERMTRRHVGDATSFMVYIPPQADKESAERQADELRRLGIKDFFVMQGDSDLRYAISLGVFKTRTAAELHLAELIKKGVHSARIGGRGANSSKLAFQFHNLDKAKAASVIKLAETVVQTEQRKCALR